MILEKLRSFKQIRKYKRRVEDTENRLEILITSKEYLDNSYKYENWHTREYLSLQLWSYKSKLKYYKNIKWF